MRAVVYDEYGPPEVLKPQEVESPMVKDDEVLVRVHAASVNQWDWDLVRGRPFIVRIGGLRKPRYPILGADIAGVVEAVGKNVTMFQRDDEVFGDISGCSWGGFAEYAVARENVLALKPASMPFEEAAAVPQAAGLALQGLRKSRIRSGQTVLINGAGGGVGTFAVQLAKSFGAEVTGVDSAGKLDLVRSIGADRVIDYSQEDYTRNGRRYDVIIDMVAHRSVFDYERALCTDGTIIVIGGSMPAIFRVAVMGPWMAMTKRKKMSLLSYKPNNKDLVRLTEFLEAGTVVPVIDRRYPLSELAAAIRYLGEGNATGKIVITV
jgi:NADPH:quinone reductase-like Zn-dependent oxidoreductase